MVPSAPGSTGEKIKVEACPQRKKKEKEKGKLVNVELFGQNPTRQLRRQSKKKT